MDDKFVVSKWLFQAHPMGDDLRDFLKGARPGQNFSWRIPHYKKPEEHMHAGDGVVLWQARGREPQASGVYALGELTGQFPERGFEAEFKLSIIRQLDDPIPTETLRQDSRLRDLAVLRPKGNSGPCFKLKDWQWEAFEDAWGTVTEALEGATITRIVSLPVQVPHVSRFAVEREALSYESERREAELVSEYAKYLERKGCVVERCAFIVGEERMECDLFERTRRNLIEAKSSTDRIAIRMAVGQLLDYAFQGESQLQASRMAILLPEKPPKDIEAWLDSLNIKLIWSEVPAFLDNANGQFT